MGLIAAVDCDLGLTLSHGGGYPGYGSHVLLLPDYGVGIFAFANRTYAGPRPPVWDAAMALQRAGLLTPRPVPGVGGADAPPTRAVGKMYAAGSITAGGDVLAMNFLMDRDAEHWARDFAALKARGRQLRHGRADRADRRAVRRLHLELRARPRQRLAAARADARCRASRRSTCRGRRPEHAPAGAPRRSPSSSRVARARHRRRPRIRRRSASWICGSTAGALAGTLTVHDFDAAHELGLPDAARCSIPATARPRRPALAELLARRLRLLVDGEPVTVDAVGPDAGPGSAGAALHARQRRSRGAPGRLTLDATLFPYDPQHQTFVNVYEDGALRQQAILDARRPAMDYYAGTGRRGAVLATFVPAGIHHIVDRPRPHPVPGRPAAPRRIAGAGSA